MEIFARITLTIFNIIMCMCYELASTWTMYRYIHVRCHTYIIMSGNGGAHFGLSQLTLSSQNTVWPEIFEGANFRGFRGGLAIHEN